jgi:hypothetical protein
VECCRKKLVDGVLDIGSGPSPRKIPGG